MTVGRPELLPVPLRSMLQAVLALAFILAVLRFGRGQGRLNRVMRLLGWASRRAAEPAEAEEAVQAIHAVRRAALLPVGRVACLEESAAVTLMLAAVGRRVRWCHGVAADPVRLHAWVVTCDGETVVEPVGTARFTVLRTI
ncbi:lasso peptide biosynthesis B2 protein [Frankia sp. Cr1]|uniref:lasso peptide biosynthesis B2 protein n=1 Tax=Frankia sp. Cr1 TaxID=3073931 RepID=UPI002AD4AB92|nr:lasso peptide biosynthesis B2 protein [Frankia sp. Cr1]